MKLLKIKLANQDRGDLNKQQEITYKISYCRVVKCFHWSFLLFGTKVGYFWGILRTFTLCKEKVNRLDDYAKDGGPGAV